MRAPLAKRDDVAASIVMDMRFKHLQQLLATLGMLMRIYYWANVLE